MQSVHLGLIPGGQWRWSCSPLQWPHFTCSLYDHAKCPNLWQRWHRFSSTLQGSTLPMYLWPTRRPLSMIDSAASGVFNQIPIDADLPRGLSFFFSHAMSSISNPFSMRSFSSKIFRIPCVFPLSRSKSSVGTRCTTIPNRGFTSLVSLPSSSSHVVLLRAVSAY